MSAQRQNAVSPRGHSRLRGLVGGRRSASVRGPDCIPTYERNEGVCYSFGLMLALPINQYEEANDVARRIREHLPRI